jgi:lysosomal Pro-X carboxypeptidase
MSAMNLSDLSNAFGLCPGQLVNASQVQAQVFPWIINALVYMAMVDYPMPTSFLGPMPSYPVTVACSYFAAPSSQTGRAAVAALSQAIGVFYNYSGESGACYDVQANGPSTLADPGGWNYQQCSEMVMPMSQDGVQDMFYPAAWNLTAYNENCRNTYGFDPRDKWILQQFGGIFAAGPVDLAPYSNIVFSNGQLDPWRGGGVKYEAAAAAAAPLCTVLH